MSQILLLSRAAAVPRFDSNKLTARTQEVEAPSETDVTQDALIDRHDVRDLGDLIRATELFEMEKREQGLFIQADRK